MVKVVGRGQGGGVVCSRALAGAPWGLDERELLSACLMSSVESSALAMHSALPDPDLAQSPVLLQVATSSGAKVPLGNKKTLPAECGEQQVVQGFLVWRMLEGGGWQTESCKWS